MPWDLMLCTGRRSAYWSRKQRWASWRYPVKRVMTAAQPYITLTPSHTSQIWHNSIALKQQIQWGVTCSHWLLEASCSHYQVHETGVVSHDMHKYDSSSRQLYDFARCKPLGGQPSWGPQIARPLEMRPLDCKAARNEALRMCGP